jgi:acyl-CoA dehydrogenase
MTRGVNLAGEPRDDVVLRGCLVPAGQWAPWPGPPGELLGHRSAAGRTILMAGAAARVLDLTVAYAGQRTQFGRPLARFQAVQQNLARMAGEAAALTAAADGAQLALSDLDAGTGVGAPARFTARVAVAKCRAGAGAVRLARLAHQVHGAIGYTEEYDLRLFTTRLWAWRSEDGDERYWATVLGRAAVESGEDVWDWLGDLAPHHAGLLAGAEQDHRRRPGRGP